MATLIQTRALRALSVSQKYFRVAANLSYRSFATAAPSSNLRKTPLHELHVNHRAKMVPYAGWSMPAQYEKEGMKDSHLWVRSKAGLFDVSHMRQHIFEGPGALAFLESLTPTDLSTLDNHSSSLTAFLHDMTGGIIDDTIVTRLSNNSFYVVTNAGCEEKDFKFLAEALNKWNSDDANTGLKVNHIKLEDRGLLALQGPLAEPVLADVLEMFPDITVTSAEESPSAFLQGITFGKSRLIPLKSGHVGGFSDTLHVARGGYTGEDGFEISVPKELTEKLAWSILDIGGSSRVHLAGLGARDSLRLEAGLCLYGNEMDDTTTPVEAGLNWIISERRRNLGDFPGAQVILNQLANKPDRKRIGFVVDGPAPVREGAKILNESGEEIGKVTSGMPSPTLGKNIGMGYVKKGYWKAGTRIGFEVRGKVREGEVAKMPFVKPNYYRG